MTESISAGPSAAPPQFNTPQAATKRIKGIRQYYRDRRRQSGQGSADPVENALPSLQPPPSRWFEPFIKTLQDEARRHEQAAQNYARVPDLFTLHIEHAARAFEIHRIIDMLTNYAVFMGPGGL